MLASLIQHKKLIMKNFFPLLFLMMPAFFLNAACPTGDILLSSQAEIDNFPSDYAGCTVMPFGIRIVEDVPGDIVNLNGLSQLTSITGYLDIGANAGLIDLTGLTSLTSVGGNVYIAFNPVLENFSGLDQLATIGGYLQIELNPALEDFTGLGALTSIGGYLTINDCSTLVDLTGLSSLATVGGQFTITNNSALINLNGLGSLTSIAANANIMNNPDLTDMSGVDMLASIGGHFQVANNNSLVNFSGTDVLSFIGSDLNLYNNNALESLMGLDALATVNGSVLISDNPLLNSIAALDALTSIGNVISISNNDELPSLTGLDNVNPTFLNLTIQNSALLAICEVLGICEYLSVPSNPATITGNAAGCADRTEVETACLPLLPIEITYFNAVQKGNCISLNWQTNSEVGNDYFLIEHSMNGVGFEAIGMVPGNGTTLRITNYEFSDMHPSIGTNYYRLKQVDYDGAFSYTKTVGIKIGADEIHVLPNPTQGIVKLNGLAESDDTIVRVYDETGKLIKELQLPASSSFDLSEQPKGLYIISIFNHNQSTTKRLYLE